MHKKWVTVAVTSEEAHLLKTRLKRNARYELGARSRAQGATTPPCSPPGEAGGSSDLLHTEVRTQATRRIDLADLALVSRQDRPRRHLWAHRLSFGGVRYVWSLYALHRRNAEHYLDTDACSTSTGDSSKATDYDTGHYERASAPGEAPPFLAPPSNTDFPQHTVNPLYLRGGVEAARQVGHAFLYGSFGTVYAPFMLFVSPFVLVAPQPPHGHFAGHHPPLVSTLLHVPPVYIAQPPGTPPGPSPPSSPPAEAGGSGLPVDPPPSLAHAADSVASSLISYNPTTPSGVLSLDSDPGVAPSSPRASTPEPVSLHWDVGDPRRPLVNEPCSCNAPPGLRCGRYASRAYDCDRWLGRCTTAVGHVPGSEREMFCSFCGIPTRHCPRRPSGIFHMATLTLTERSLYHFCQCQCGPECVPEDTPATSDGPHSRPPTQGSEDPPPPPKRSSRSPPPNVPWGKQPRRLY